MYSLKAHLINQNKNMDGRENIIKNLMSFQRHKDYETYCVEAMMERKVLIPKELSKKGITLKDIGKLKCINRIPIAVYRLKNMQN